MHPKANSLLVPNRCQSGALAVIFATATTAMIGLSYVPWSVGSKIVSEISPFHGQLVVALESKNVTTLAFGDSHTGLGFHSETSSALSLGWPENLVDTDARISWAIERFPSLRTVSFQFQPHMFYSHRDRVERSALSRTLDNIEPAWHPLSRWFPQFHQCCRAKVLEWQVRKLLGRQRVHEPIIKQNGYLVYRYKSNLSMSELARLEIGSYGSTIIVDRLAQRYEEIIRKLIERGFEVVLTRYPLTLEYRLQLGASALEQAERFQDHLRSQFPRLQVCGQWNWSDDDALFINSDHLSEDGARTYWRDLSSCLESRRTAASLGDELWWH